MLSVDKKRVKKQKSETTSIPKELEVDLFADYERLPKP
jgi:hypothetical protein